MATRYYFPAEGSGTPAISPAFDAGWEQTGQATRLKLLNKKTLSVLSTIGANGTRTVPITTTQDILMNQFISEPLVTQRVIGNFSMVMSFLASATTENCRLACVVRVLSNDGGTIRGTLFSTFSTGSTLTASTQTRIVPATAMTATTIQTGDRLVIEVGMHAAAPSTAGTYTGRQGNNNAADFALTAALTTDLNPWCEFSADLLTPVQNNYMGIRADTGMSVTERVR